MKLIIHDRPVSFTEHLRGENVHVLEADGKYAPCRGCFECWIKTPGKCTMKDKLKDFTTVLSNCDELVVITENCYGGFSPAVKTCFDRSIGSSLPFLWFKERQMIHSPRYKKSQHLRVYVYGDITEQEEVTFRQMVDRVRRNFSFETAVVTFVGAEELEGLAV